MADEKKEAKQDKGGFNIKIIILGLPLFIVQLIAVYFITANLLMDKFAQNAAYENIAEDVEIVEKVPEKDKESGSVIFAIEDMVVNPMMSHGDKLLLVSIGLELEDEDSKNILAEKEVILKDKIISLLSAKTQKTLSQPDYKDSLKIQLSAGIKNIFPDVKLNNIYFSKYIID